MNKTQDEKDHSADRAEADSHLPWNMPRFRNWVACAKVNQLVKRAMHEGLADVGLEFPQYELLAAIFRYPGMTQQELANKLLVGRSNLSMLLPEMERGQLVERRQDPSDKRLRRLFLTQEGEAQAREGLAVQVRVIEHMMAAITAEECEMVGDIMRRLGRHMAGATPPL
jgi:MarR family transcriptional regulator, organic hydroperoxide resistance regulator